ncbi:MULTISPECIES: GNAT family N-acetyltransferase [Sphingobacterium]|uniref:GNAT family N-acetyltransferase n=1 Tax=Sphingobacterium chuzhouense TaxID=1742264 RepID=A0ABR7XP90_9SPHI|nr:MULTISPECIES: GNAT family N-acetyltransferase [Sphingobacterium]MBD1420963.1 GNAT family N-acetyltransferase [Sphingobacterium chuzhouense]NGM65649.1 GNAT family N-acetyltransferase [Sphingobacterium sp. SGR-19]
MEYSFRQAQSEDIPQIWEILERAIQRRKEEGSNQWQDGYPNVSVIRTDIEKGHGYVLTDGGIIAGYCAILINDEPAYANLQGQWLTAGDFVVYHRVALAEEYLGKGLAQKMLLYIEDFARQHNIYSVKADTNFDNGGMLNIFKKLGYAYCGEVFFRGAPRKAFEKVIAH